MYPWIEGNLNSQNLLQSYPSIKTNIETKELEQEPQK